MSKRKTRDENIADFVKVHGDKYDYSKFDTQDIYEKGTIICHKIGKDGKEHGEFQMSANTHKNGHGCKKCWREALSSKQRKANDKIIEEFKEIHGNKYVYDKVEYVNRCTPVCIICPEHGEFWQTPHNHKMGKGCNKCANKSRSLHHIMPQSEYVQRVKEKYGDEYDLSDCTYVGMNKPIRVICHKKDKYGKEHGMWYPTAGNFLFKSGCPNCQISKLEEQTRILLEHNDVSFEQQKKFIWLKSNKNWPMSLDFYLAKFNIAIECQGIQHYESNTFYTEEMVNETQQRDILKHNLCKEHGIPIYYINYNDNVEEKVAKLIETLKKSDVSHLLI